MTTTIEKEKRFLLKSEPIIPIGSIEVEITQFYIKSEDQIIRFREIHHPGNGQREYFMTKKDGYGFTRMETELQINYDIYDFFYVPTAKSIYKRRITTLEKNPWEIDIFTEENYGIIIAEFEFHNGIDENDFSIPNYIKDVIIKDVTGIKKYSNYSLAKS